MTVITDMAKHTADKIMRRVDMYDLYRNDGYNQATKEIEEILTETFNTLLATPELGQR